MKKTSPILLLALPLILASCGGSNPASSSTTPAASSSTTPAASSATGTSGAETSSVEPEGPFNPSTYAGYQIDLNGDGTITEDEKNLTWAESFDQIISDIKKENDNTLRFKKMHAAEDLLMDTGCLSPIYYYTDAFMKKTGLKGFYSQPLGIKFFDEATYNDQGKFTVCIASAPDTIDPHLNSSVDGGTMDSSLFQGLTRWSHEGEYGTDDYKAKVVNGDAESIEKVANDDGTVTVTYTLKDNLKWSDGSSYNAYDYERSWRRAVNATTASDYAYLYEAVVGGEAAEGEEDGASLDIKATDATHFVVKLAANISYWDQLTAFPTFYPVPQNADADGNWIALGATGVLTNGAMKLKDYNESSIVMEANPYYVDKDRVKATEVTYAFSDDAEGQLRSYAPEKGNADGCWALIDEIDPAMMTKLKTDYPNEFFNPGQLGTYYVCFNIRDRAFDAVLNTETKRQDFRKALGLLIDRNYIIDDVAQNGATPADGFVSMGLTEPDGKDWTAARTPYYDASAEAQASNEAKAVETIKSLGYNYDESSKKFTNVPTLKYIYNTSNGHKAIAEALQSCFAKYGITMTLENQEWATFLETRKAGDYSVARNGWLCDYDDPISMLDMWVTASGNNDVGYGKQPL